MASLPSPIPEIEAKGLLISTEIDIIYIDSVLIWKPYMHNTVTVAEIKRRGMAAIDEGLRRGPVRIIKRNKSAAVVLSEEEYQRLVGEQPQAGSGMTALQWLLTQPPAGSREKAEIDARLAEERDW